jgi:plasmid stabilization system protein ParE
VRWSDPALDDLAAAAEYIARDSRYFAAALVRDNRDAARCLDQLAERGRLLPQLGSDVRKIFVQSYRLIYEAHSDTVDILAFVHGARDLAVWESARSAEAHAPTLPMLTLRRPAAGSPGMHSVPLPPPLPGRIDVVAILLEERQSER